MPNIISSLEEIIAVRLGWVYWTKGGVALLSTVCWVVFTAILGCAQSEIHRLYTTMNLDLYLCSYINTIIPYTVDYLSKKYSLPCISHFTTLVKISSILRFLSQAELLRRWMFFLSSGQFAHYLCHLSPFFTSPSPIPEHFSLYIFYA